VIGELNAEAPFSTTQVLDVEVPTHKGLERVNRRCRGSGTYKVIHVNRKKNWGARNDSGVETGVGRCPLKADLIEHIIKPTVPTQWRLFEAVHHQADGTNSVALV